MRIALRRLTWLCLVACLAALPIAQAQQPIAGKDYQVIKPAQPTESGNKIEVLEFFWYGCPHCAHLQPSLRAWLKRKPADVDFKHQPAAFQDSWLQLARTYYAIESLGLTEKLHYGLFEAIHNRRTLDPATLARDQKSLFDWVASNGVDRKKFTDAYNSFAVVSKTQRTIDLTMRYDIPGTPALVIDGRYLTGPSMMLKSDRAIDYDRFFQVVDQLIAMARKNHGGK
ncbi:MAG TPA: thiol:disulfide interchange protein DsbA/DsbL [Burkholderiales bacterium]|jgi:Protein-disulfide isomerase